MNIFFPTIRETMLLTAVVIFSVDTSSQF